MKFNEITKSEQRVAIAKDVLEWLDVYGLTQGIYLSTVESTLDGISQNCRVCALGATFLSSIRVGKEFDERKIRYAMKEEMRSHLTRWFPMDQILLIEAAFERYVCINGMEKHCNGWEYVNSCGSSDHRGMLGKIMENIIENSGTFNPSAGLVTQGED